MLMLGRRVGQRIMIGPDIVVTVVEIDRKTVRLGIDAPADVPVNREEVLRRAGEQAPDTYSPEE